VVYICYYKRVITYTYVQTNNVTAVVEARSASARLFAGTWRPLVSVITTLYYVAIIFHRRVWYRTLFLRVFAKNKSSDIILIPRLPLCQISFFAASIAELAHGK